MFTIRSTSLTISALTLSGAVVAAALVGAGSATAARLLTGADIANGSLTGKDIKQASITAADLASSAKIAGATGPTGQTGPAGPTGPAGLPPAGTLRGYEVVEGPSLIVKLGKGMDASLDCPDQKAVLSGGVTIADGMPTIETYRTWVEGSSTFGATVENVSKYDNRSFNLYVVCAAIS